MLLSSCLVILVYKYRPERTGFKMYAEYTQPQLAFLALLYLDPFKPTNFIHEFSYKFNIVLYQFIVTGTSDVHFSLFLYNPFKIKKLRMKLDLIIVVQLL